MRNLAWGPKSLKAVCFTASGFALIALAMLTTACAPATVDAYERPPIILITLDTTRRDALSAYNGDPTTTPALHEFAKTATVFERAYATAPWTLPTHASMFSGLFPSRHGAGVRYTKFPKNVETLPELLKQAGYRSGGISGGPFTNTNYGLGRGFDSFENTVKKIERASDQVAKARKFLEQEDPRPFFLFMNFFDAHAPYHPPSAFQKRYKLNQKQKTLESLPRWADAFGGYGLRVRKLRAMGEPEPEAVDYLKAAYAAEVAFVDEHLGRFFDYLKRRDIFDKALIVVVADHGEMLGEGGRYLHSYTVDPILTHVPLLIKWPEQKLGNRNPVLVSHVDLFATALHTAGLAPPTNDGLALSPDMAVRDRWVLIEEHKIDPIHPLVHEEDFIANHLYAIQTATARGVIWEGQNRCERLEQGFWKAADCGHSWKEDMNFIQNFLKLEPQTEEEAVVLDEAEAETLRSLGYIQ